MDSTHTSRRRRPEEGFAGRPPAEPAAGHPTHPPIYAQLVAEWRSEGRTVPERREVFEVLWASFAAPDPSEGEPRPAGSQAVHRRVGPPSRPSDVRTEPAPEKDVGEQVPAVPVPRGLPGR
ncbi:hypothetical protein ACFVTC_35120 [Streptomyces sp. NPDC057950]|uniref:hypothetical protein n=1 Tax=Streptomyces sp. NPDC057950 TaxID=3346288 RepID=UPI0036ECDEBC